MTNPTVGLKYEDLRRECLYALRRWPGCESVAGIQIIGLTYLVVFLFASHCMAKRTAGFRTALSGALNERNGVISTWSIERHSPALRSLEGALAGS
jgi:hypothetical protein